MDGAGPVSAFAVYAHKRKGQKTPTNPKKLKNKHVPVAKTPVQQSNIVPVVKFTTDKKSNSKPNKVSVATGIQIMKKNIIFKKAPASIAIKKKKIKKQVNRKASSATTQIQQNNNLPSTSLPVETINNNNNPVTKSKVNVIPVKHIASKKQKSEKKQKQVATTSNAATVLVSPLDSQVSNGNEGENPLDTSRNMFQWLIHPLQVDDFFQQNWEKTPVHIKRGRPSYFKFLMSTQLLDKLLRESHIAFTKNIDITSFSNGVRETHNPPGRALPSVVWDYYLNGCSVRMLNPQTYIPKLHTLNATLQEFFGCFVGANSYLTPPDSQGFAPHYDDIEAFILQIEGKKRWRLYKPRTENEYLSRFSSKNFDQSEIGEPILDTVVSAGDLLYFPRGTIHQGETIDDTHSLHITLSVYQRNSWGDFLEKLVPQALQTAIDSDVEFREGLPIGYLRQCGFVHSENSSYLKTAFKEHVKNLFSKIIDHIDIDKAADCMAQQQMHDFLPPILTDGEKECSVLEDGEQMTGNGIVQNRVEIEPDTKIRLLRSHTIRLVEEDDTHRIYYSTENSKEYHEYEPQFLELGGASVSAVKELILRYPEYIRVEDLPIEREDDKIQITKDLWEKCILVTENPLCVLD